MLRKTLLLCAGLALAGSALGQELLVNGGFETGLTGWTQASVESAGTFESVPSGGSHIIDDGCMAPAAFPGGGDFWAVSCQPLPDIHVLYQDFTVPGGAVLRGVAGVDMCSVPGGPCDTTKRWSGDDEGGLNTDSLAAWITGKGAGPDCSDVVLKGDGDCARVDIVDPAADVLDETDGVLMPLFFAENIDAPASQSPDFDLSAFAGQTVRIRLWVQANNAEVALQVDTLQVLGQSAIPVLHPIGLGTLFLVLGAAGALIIRRRQRRV